MDLVEFLRARLDEDEAKAEESNDSENFRLHVRRLSDDVRHPIYLGAGRLLAEVEAKRRIIARYEEQAAKASESALEEDRAWTLEPILALLALPYADHPAYRDEWKP